MLALATLAAVIASQALISGAFSLTQQAVQLGYSPRMTIVHTSGARRGQIYIPAINWLLMLACLALVLAFQQRRARWRRPTASRSPAPWRSRRSCSTPPPASAGAGAVAEAGALVALFLVVDLAFLGANLAKIAQGGWVPLAVAAGGRSR